MSTFLKRLLLSVLFLSPIPVLAQHEPPARVGRVSIADGALAFYGPGDSDWSAAPVNLPVGEGGWFATDPQSRAQFRIGPDVVDLASGTEINFAALRESFMQVAVSQGRVYLHLQRSVAGPETNEVDLARGGVWLAQPGIYDIHSGTGDEPIRITVFEGRARFVGDGVDRTVISGQELSVIGSDVLSGDIQPAIADGFDEWCRAHEYRGSPRVATARVSPAITGISELAEYGTWNTVPQYGAVWFPRTVQSDWVPYRDGHWVWIEPWGWNWVDDEPWGFAPCHYGRWARIGHRWAWVPGEYVPEPVYAPALVAFIPPEPIEAAVSIPVADAGPPVGWFPLAPGEVYWPTYTRDPSYIRNVNISNVSVTKITNVTNVIANQPAATPPPQVVEQSFANRTAGTVVPARVFANSAPVAAAAVAVPAAALQKANVAVKPPPVVSTPPAEDTAKAPPPSAAAPAAPGTAAKATPAHPPAKPQFTNLSPAPRVAQPAATEKSQPSAASPSTATPAHPPAGAEANRQVLPAPSQKPEQPAAIAAVPPVVKNPAGAAPRPLGAPDFSHLPQPKAPAQTPAATVAPPQATPGATVNREPGAPGEPTGQAAAQPPQHPPAPPNFGHRAPHSATPGTPAAPQRSTPAQTEAQAPPAPLQQPPQAGPAENQPNAHVPPAAENRRIVPAPDHATQQRALEDQAKQRAAAEAQQKSAAEAAHQKAAQQAQQRAPTQAAQQRVAAEAQQRAAAQAAQQQASAEAQRRAAAQAAQQHAAAEAQRRAAAQAAQQHAAAEAQRRAAAQAAQQRAEAEAQQRAAAQAAQQRAEAEAQKRAATQAAQQRAAAEPQQHAAQQAHHEEPNCGRPGLPPCPK
jgi:hypothetical protein